MNGALTAAFIAFVTAVAGLPLWIRRKGDHGLVGRDMHKRNHPAVAEQGGVVVAIAVLAGMFALIAMQVFAAHKADELVLVLAALLSFTLAAFLGFMDGVLGWRKGIRQLHKVLLSLLIPLPLMTVNAGTHVMNLPFWGAVDLGLLYPLLMIPAGVVGAANGFNMLAGYNGLEAGMASIILGALSLIAWAAGAPTIAVFGLVCVAAALAFLFYNRYPSRVFPGDSFTYAMGTAIAAMAILGNIELYAVLLFLPYVVELALKTRGWLSRQTGRWMGLSRVRPDGSLAAPGRWLTIPHIAIDVLRAVRIRPTEARVVALVLLGELVLAACVVAYFFAR
jgi:UDP-N-acetylglucosamine--dolichyl-phosphate N-acetylglucosaminephosphotransferase